MSDAQQLFHVGKNGPAPCNASKRACRYGSHFPTMNEAAAAFESSMDEDLFESVSKKEPAAPEVSKAPKELSPELARIDAMLEDGNLTSAEKLQEVGELLGREVSARAGIEFGKDEYTPAERAALSLAVSETLKELQGEEVPFTAELHGKFAKSLKEAIGVFPSGANSLVVNPIYTEQIRSNNQSQDGYHAAQAIVYKPAASSLSNFSFSGNYEVGDMIFQDAFTRADDFNNGLIGVAAEKVLRPAGPLQAGESLMDFHDKLKYMHGYEETLLGMIEDGTLDGSSRLVAGREEDFKKVDPKFSQIIESTILTESYYVGKKPGVRDGKAKKLANFVDIKSNNGEVKRVEQPLWQVEEKTMDYRAHTIAAKSYYDGPSSSVLAHEFVHAIQSQPGGIPGEKEMFQKIYPKGELKTSDHYKYYDSFPDDYMGDQGGRELFTRASEGLFYSSEADPEPFMFRHVNNGKEMRDWALGAWAVLAKRGAVRGKKS